MIKLFDNALSGHGHRVRTFLNMLDLEHEIIEVDMASGAHKSEDFLKLNPLGQVPVLVDGELTLRDSTAMLVYLASKYDKTGHWLPNVAESQAYIQSWLAISTRELYDGPFKARLVKLFNRDFDHDRAVNQSKSLFQDVFESHLSNHEWLVGNDPTIADIANYSYIARSPEGGIDLTPYPCLVMWLRRVENLDRFVPMPAAASVLATTDFFNDVY